jgi:hypothetical protein
MAADPLFTSYEAEIRRLRAALGEAIELIEEYAQYVSPFLLEKWGHTDDLARIKGALIDGKEAENRGSTSDV